MHFTKLLIIVNCVFAKEPVSWGEARFCQLSDGVFFKDFEYKRNSCSCFPDASNRCVSECLTYSPKGTTELFGCLRDLIKSTLNRRPLAIVLRIHFPYETGTTLQGDRCLGCKY